MVSFDQSAKIWDFVWNNLLKFGAFFLALALALFAGPSLWRTYSGRPKGQDMEIAGGVIGAGGGLATTSVGPENCCKVT